MINKDQMQTASDLLYNKWLDQTTITELPVELRPTTRAEGYGIQACIERHTQAPLFGWKIAATSIAGQAHIRVEGPLAGRILAERVIENGGRCILGNSLMRVAELELAFHMAASLPPRGRPYSQEDVMQRVGSLHPAIELPDSRLEPFEHAGAEQLLADNACAHRFILGPACEIEWRSLDLSAHCVRGFLNGIHVRDGIGANVLGDPRMALTWLANELLAYGFELKAGQVVTTGTCVVPIGIEAGDYVEGDFGDLGCVAISID